MKHASQPQHPNPTIYPQDLANISDLQETRHVAKQAYIVVYGWLLLQEVFHFIMWGLGEKWQKKPFMSR